MKHKTASAKTLDHLFDEGSDALDQYLDWQNARPAGEGVKRINVDFPQWMVAELDREAKRRGITRQALIKTWLADRLDAAA